LNVDAQFSSPQAQDPLISLMQAQPKIEINGPINPIAAFDPPIVRPGQQSILRVTFSALEQSIEMPDALTAPKELTITNGAHGQILQMTGPSLVPLTTYNYRVQGGTTGSFTMPEFVAQVYGKPIRVPAARLEVSDNPPASIAPSQHLILEIPEATPFVGQAIVARIRLPGLIGGAIQSLGQVQFTGPGVIVDQGAVRQRIEPMRNGGSSVAAYVYETMLTPIESGKLSIFAQGFTSGSRFSGPIVINGTINVGGQPQYTLLESDLVQITARPLPREGELAGFTGAIGSYSVDPPTLATNVVRAGEPVKLMFNVRGGGNLARIVPPPAPRAQDWQAFAIPANNTAVPTALVQGFVTFSYTIIPLSEKVHATPSIPFSYFDPEAGGYKDLTVPSVSITVQPGSVPAVLASVIKADSNPDDPEKDLILSGLATAPGRTSGSLTPLQRRSWFPLVQLFPAAAFFGLWLWDRRRRYLEAHPEVLLRRRAKRALRREWRSLRQAARAGDAMGFATSAVSAMRVACAPHYPAEPRALVGADVLQMLDQRPGELGTRVGESSLERPIGLTLKDRLSILPGGFPGPGSKLSESVISSGENDSGSTAEVVRRFFNITDAGRFDNASSDASELLALQPKLDEVLQRLEARL
jgi:hypothetical protein